MSIFFMIEADALVGTPLHLGEASASKLKKMQWVAAPQECIFFIMAPPECISLKLAKDALWGASF